MPSYLSLHPTSDFFLFRSIFPLISFRPKFFISFISGIFFSVSVSICPFIISFLYHHFFSILDFFFLFVPSLFLLYRFFFQFIPSIFDFFFYLSLPHLPQREIILPRREIILPRRE